MLGKLRSLVLIAGAIVSVVVSTNIKVVRQLNPDTNYPPSADSFSNRKCSSSTCSSRSTCAGGSCCMCKCLYDYPNVFVNRTSLKCMNYGELNGMSSANCQYSFRTSNEPLEVLPLTEATGRIRFRNDSARVDCTENGLTVGKWHFLDVNGRWQNGEGDVFVVDFKTVGGPDGNKKDLTFLNWNARLESKYAGLLIRLSLVCGGRNIGCILAKINGTHTYDIPQTTTNAPVSTSTSQQPSTDTPSTPVSEEITTLPSSSPTREPKSTTVSTPGTDQETTPRPTPVSEEITTLPSSSPTREPESTTVSTPGTDQETTPGPTPGPNPRKSSVRPSVQGSDSSKENGLSRSADQQRESNTAKNASSSAAIGPALGTIGGLICLICLVCLIVVLYRRRKRRLSKEPEADSETKLEDYQDPIYAELPDNTETAGDFDNPFYCDPTEEQFKIRSKQDPLPALPVDESTYQPLDQNTRTVVGTPVSYPLDDAKPEESADYLNPDREESDTVDYDNPLVSSQIPIQNESSDYDNPPLGSSPPTNTPRLENSNNESSDYDNPPVLSIPRGVPAESTEDAASEPEYFVLEPEESSL